MAPSFFKYPKEKEYEENNTIHLTYFSLFSFFRKNRHLDKGSDPRFFL